MTPYLVCLWAASVGGPLCILFGLVVLIFGQRVKISNSVTIKLKLLDKIELEIPWAGSIFVAIIGVVLILMVLSLASGGEPKAARAPVSILSEAVAQEQEKPDFPSGWVYFGHESSPKQWNFRVLGGSYADLQNTKQGLVLKSLRTVPVREDHFGNFTGTIFEFLSPEPKKIGTVPDGACAKPIAVVSVGLSKIWVKISPMQCPQ